jgi:hypothetical protein
MRIKEVVTAPRSPWQNAHVERFIGSLRSNGLAVLVQLCEQTERSLRIRRCPF